MSHREEIIISDSEDEKETKEPATNLTCLRPPMKDKILRLQTYFRSYDHSFSLQVGKWPSTFQDPVQCYDEIAKYLDALSDTVWVDGKQVRRSRETIFFSNGTKGYTYTDTLGQHFELTPTLQLFLQQVNDTMGTRSNGVLVNRYRTGKDNSVASHQDRETRWDPSGVFSVTIFPHSKSIAPPTRKFRLQSDPLVTNKIVFTIPGSVASTTKIYHAKPEGIHGEREKILDVHLGHMDCCWMEGEQFQNRVFHALPNQASCTDVRVSFTCRYHPPSQPFLVREDI